MRSAQCATWDVGVYRPGIEQYTNPTSGNPGATFRCMLVSLPDPTSYVAGEVNIPGADNQKIQAATNKYKDELLFNISKVLLKPNSKQQYLH